MQNIKTWHIVFGLFAVLVIGANVAYINYTPSVSRTSLSSTTTPIPEKKNTRPFKIGSILQLTGDFALFGGEIQKGITIAVDEAKAQGVVLEYVSEDDQSKAQGTVNAAKKLITIDRADALLTATVQQVKPIAQTANESGVPLLATWDSNEYLKTAGSQIYTIGFSTEEAGEKMALHAYNVLHLRRVGVIPQIDEWSELIASAFEKKFVSLGGEVPVQDKAQATQKDFRTLISKAKSAQVDGLYFPFLPTSIGAFLVQADQIGLHVPMMTADSFSNDEIKIAGKAAEGVIFTGLYAEETTRLSEKYNARFKTEPTDPVFVSFGYDGARTLIEADRIRNTEGLSLSDALKRVTIKGTGAPISMGGRHYSEKYEKLYIVKNGQIEELK